MTVLPTLPVPLPGIDRVTAATVLAHAPSVHGTRPWRLETHGTGLALRTDPRQRLLATDPDSRDLRLSCGAALLTLRLAVAAQGVRTVVTLLPDPARPRIVATLYPAGVVQPTSDETALFAAVPHRRSHRVPFAPRRVSAAHRLLLRRAAEVEGAWLHAVDEPDERRRVRDLLLQAHRHQWVDPGFRAEWRSRTPEPVQPGDRPARTDTDPSALLLVLGTRHDLPVAQLRAGQALQRVLLTATALGLVSSVLSAATEVRVSREVLGRMYGPGLHPQIIVRVGHPADD
ncbi:nitroreductase [Pseudonocardia hydrocarbonoxydans]|uniref:nitroreductase n=1 Tax=Pseudonocardia hydrocarbonoxydans TaxID=76726 RepID=UPI0031D04CAB